MQTHAEMPSSKPHMDKMHAAWLHNSHLAQEAIARLRQLKHAVRSHCKLGSESHIVLSVVDGQRHADVARVWH